MPLLTIMLEADITGALMSRLGDQMFSIVLLVVYAIYAERKQNKQNDKLDRYIQEDREKMMEVIERNSKVMEKAYEAVERNTRVLESHGK